MNRAYTEAEQRHRNLLLTFALAAHHADTGKYPEVLITLAPKYLKAIPDDLFTGTPMGYTQTDDGCCLFSVGANGRDDGGGGDDVVVRMSRKPKR